MTPTPVPTTPHASAAEQQPSGSRAAANCTAPNRLSIQISLRPRVVGGQRSSMILRADTWRCSQLGVQSRKNG
jgi:hypothetical protein